MIVRSIIVLTLAISPLASASVFSQEVFWPFSHLGVGFKVSTLGYGLEAATPLSELFIIRLGINLTNGMGTGYMNIPIPDDRDDDGVYLSDRFGYVPDYRARMGPNFTHGNLLLDFHPQGFFHFTAGIFIGTTNLKLNGYLADYNNNYEPAILNPQCEWPTIDIGGVKVDLTDGRSNIDLQIGLRNINPYFGLGMGRAVPKYTRWGFKFELGGLWQRGYSLKNNAMALDISASDEVLLRDLHNYLIKYAKVWPMLNLQLSYRL